MAVRRTIAFLMMLMLVLPVWQSRAFSASVSEYQIKAAFLYNFAKFVDWPSTASDDEKNIFKIGILGADPFGAEISVIEKKLIRGMPLRVIRADALSELSGCRVIFLSASVELQLTDILSRLQKTPVLTVGDTSGFAHRGVIINLITVGNKIRFQVNTEAAERAGLKISSHLLRLANIVESGTD